MRKLICVVVASLTAAAMPIGLSAAPTLAATTTWTVTPGGSFTGGTGQTVLWDTANGTQTACPGGNLTGSLKSGTGLNGSGIGTIASITLCSSSQRTAWRINARSYDPTAAGGTATLEIIKVHFAVTESNCSFVVDGSSDTAHNGRIRLKFRNKYDKLHGVDAGSVLHYYDVTGCNGIRDGDTLFLATSYGLAPSQTITSP